MTIYACPAPDCERISSDPDGCEEHRPVDEPDIELFDWEHELDDFTTDDGRREPSVARILDHLDQIDREEGST